MGCYNVSRRTRTVRKYRCMWLYENYLNSHTIQEIYLWPPKLHPLMSHTANQPPKSHRRQATPDFQLAV
jgi:hypothetical protein